ncbi:hypothetical protein PIB30_096824 [Stylosanthes scabra]|uniref:Uncharacterized protein n=1 Tax=Stylosanthes scabra TaxID=79078 RepID=A0ABU6YWR5_9FABA|nr:hypothetical protein [Stylosanthes scabra]
MRQERMRYEKILEEAAAQKAKEQNKGKVREVEEDYDDEETEDEGGEWLGKVNPRSALPLDILNQSVLDYRLNT